MQPTLEGSHEDLGLMIKLLAFKLLNKKHYCLFDVYILSFDVYHTVRSYNYSVILLVI